MDFLALGVKTVQFCTIVMKQGYGIIHDLESGTSFLMQERGIHSMKDLIGLARPHPVTDFMALTPIKKISEARPEFCVSCGNCARCPYLAITLDEQGLPQTDPSRCQEVLHRSHPHAFTQRRRTCRVERKLGDEP
jgi:dihydropyrimidine dehydrogenase (NAD+) subunit PreA